jgi:hypothetical protein
VHEYFLKLVRNGDSSSKSLRKRRPVAARSADQRPSRSSP